MKFTLKLNAIREASKFSGEEVKLISQHLEDEKEFNSFLDFEKWVEKINFNDKANQYALSRLIESTKIVDDSAEKPDNILRGLGIQYNLLQNYRAIFLTSSTFLLSLTIWCLAEIYVANCERDKWVYLSFFFGTSLASFLIILKWRVVESIRGYIVWFHQFLVFLFENGKYKPYCLYSDVLEFQTLMRDKVSSLRLRSHSKRVEVFVKILEETLTPFSYRFHLSINDMKNFIESYSNIITDSKMRQYHTHVRRGYLTVSFILLITSSVLIISTIPKGKFFEVLDIIVSPFNIDESCKRLTKKSS